MVDEIEALVQRLTELETRQAEMEENLVEARQLIDQYRRKQVKESSLAPLAEALSYHHKMVHAWTRLALTGNIVEPTAENMKELHTEFVKMRQVVTHYEYVAQMLLGINPSPLADLEE